MIIEILAIGAAGVLAASLWPRIVDLLARRLIPFLRAQLGNVVAEAVADLVSWIDAPACLARSALKAAWRAFQTTVLGVRTQYVQTSATKAQARTTSCILDGEGRVKVREEVEEIDYCDLPAEVRAAMNRQGVRFAELDVKQTVASALQEVARRRGETLEATC